MKDVKLILDISSKLLLLSSNERRICDDLPESIYSIIPKEWCDDARKMNSPGGGEEWPPSPEYFGIDGLMWFLSKKLLEISIQIDREFKLNDLNDDFK